MIIRHTLPELPAGFGRLLLVPLVLGLMACATPLTAAPPVTVTANQTNVVAYWNDIANKTVLATSTVNTTPEEHRATFFFDLASVHVAIYDAVVAIEGGYKPFAVKPKAPAHLDRRRGQRGRPWRAEGSVSESQRVVPGGL